MDNSVIKILWESENLKILVSFKIKITINPTIIAGTNCVVRYITRKKGINKNII